MAALEKCRYCHQLIRWVETMKGKRLPLDPDPVDSATIVIGYDGRARFLQRAGAPQCRVCGCTEATACVVNGYACSWIEPFLCTACEGKAARRFVAHVSTCSAAAQAGGAGEAAAAARRATMLAIEQGRTAAEGLPPAPAAPRLPAAFPEWRRRSS